MPHTANEPGKLFLWNRIMSLLMVSCSLVVIKQLCKEHVRNATICCEIVNIADFIAFWTTKWHHQGQDKNEEILGI